MSSVINFSALINHVTNKNRFYERHETLTRWLCVFGLILRQGNSSSNGWFIILSILWKKVILNTLGRIARSYELYAHGISFIRGPHRKKIVLRQNEDFLCSNQERIMDQMASRLSMTPKVLNMETTIITSFKISRSRTVWCRPAIRSKKKSLNFPGALIQYNTIQ